MRIGGKIHKQWSPERRIERLENLVTNMMYRLSTINKRASDIYHNQKHYLRYRAKGVGRRDQILLGLAHRLQKKLAGFPNISNVKTHHRGKRMVLLVTPNHARKLRAIAAMDLRPLLNSKANQGKKRIMLNGGGRSSYIRTE